VAEADAAFLIADDHQCREAEAPAALHHLGDAIDVDELVDKLARFALTAALAATFALSSGFTCHIAVLSSVQKLSPPSRAASASALTRPW
jgi:hypothetical protein